jgi:nucleoside-diphosphate-sugar epimerase
MKVLVAGGGGALGRAAVDALSLAGHDVIAPTRASEASQPRCDLTDRVQLTALMSRVQPEIVVDLITDLGERFRTLTLSSAYRRDHATRSAVTTNLRQSAAGAGVSRLITQTVCFTSEAGPGPADEARPLLADPPKPWDVLVRTQRLVESTVLAPGGPDGVVLRLGFLWGPGTWWSADGAYTRAVLRRRFPLIGDGRGRWGWLHVHDAAAAIVRAVEHGDGVINVAQDHSEPMAKWLPALAQAGGAPPPRRLPSALARALGAGVAAHTAQRLPAPRTERAAHVLRWRSQRRWSPSAVLDATGSR